MALTLPKKLNKEPLIDAIFEVRFTSRLLASEILPGYLFSKLNGNKSVSQLPTGQIPKVMRDSNPHLWFTPITRLEWDQFFVNMSDRSISISCKLPYSGWEKFKSSIIEIINISKSADIIESVERYSIKYVDLLASTDLKEQINFLNFNVMLAGHQLEKEVFQLKIEIPGDGFINAIQLASSAQVTLLDGAIKEGVIVDVDTIFNLSNTDMDGLLENFSNKLETLHEANKATFFNCLKPDTILILEPIYE